MQSPLSPQKIGIEREHIGTILESFFKAITSSLEKDEDVFIRGFSFFKVKKRSAKIGPNITKNVAVEIPACYIPLY
jgi:DNA-binding protein HU-beta